MPLPPGMREMPRRAIFSAGSPAMFWPSNVILPAVGGRRPTIDLSNVDFPAPLVPSRASMSSEATAVSTPKSTCSEP